MKEIQDSIPSPKQDMEWKGRAWDVACAIIAAELIFLVALYLTN